MQYFELIQSITDACEDAEAKKLYWGGTGRRYGRYFHLPPNFKNLWLGVDFEAWRRRGVSPLWLALQVSEQILKWEKWLEEAETEIERGDKRLSEGLAETEDEPTEKWLTSWKKYAATVRGKIEGQSVPGLRGNQARLVRVLQDLDDEAHDFEERVLLPVRLRTGEEEDIVVKDAARQVSRIGEALAAAFGDGNAGSKANTPPKRHRQ